MPFNLKGLLQDEEFLFAAGLLQQGSQGKNIGEGAFSSLVQAGKIKKAFTPTTKKTKQAFDNVLGKNVFVTDAEIAGMPDRFTPIDSSQSISVNADGSVDINSGSGKKLIEKNKINDIRASEQLKGTYSYLKDFIPTMQEKATNAPSGFVGGSVAVLDMFGDQINQLGEFTGVNSKIKFGNKTEDFLNSVGLKKDAANYAKLKGSVTKLGYSLAKIEEPDNPRLSEGDVLRQLGRINFGGSRNQFVNSLQGILEDEYISSRAKFNTLNPTGEWNFEDPRNKTATGSNIGANTTNQGLEEDILGYFQ